MWFTFPRITAGCCTATPSRPGLFGTRILEFGLAVRISRSELASESVGSHVLDGAVYAGLLPGVALDVCHLTSYPTLLVVRCGARGLGSADPSGEDRSPVAAGRPG
jgi:hypothetical protein